MQSSVLDEMIEGIVAVSGELMSIWFIPAAMYILVPLRNESQFIISYGITQSQMIYYILFAAIMIPSQTVVDILTLNIMELFHGSVERRRGRGGGGGLGCGVVYA